MGGEDIIKFTKEDYYNLFSFDKSIKIWKQQERIKMLESERNLKTEYKALETKYNAILNSKSWKLTAPLRKCAKWVRKFVKKLKNVIKCKNTNRN